MNILRKAMTREVAELKPVLDRVYAAILRFQQDRTRANEAALRTAMETAIRQLMPFQPLLPAYKQRDFSVLADTWQELAASDLIMLFDHCVSIMHVHLERRTATWEKQQPWSTEMLHLLDSYRNAPAVKPMDGEYVCSGIAASPGRATGVARVILGQDGVDAVGPGEILVTRFAVPELVPLFHRIRAVVTDEGGAVCHAAVMAREVELPAVTGCGHATAVIRAGDVIQVDGDLGVVMSAASAKGLAPSSPPTSSNGG